MKTALERIHEAYAKHTLEDAKKIHAQINEEERERSETIEKRGYRWQKRV